jgi:aromatic ring-opening dioxygenase catalytic subunit (LigB family)
MEPSHPAQKAQLVYLSHGGGPLPILGDPGHAAMVGFLRRLGPRLRRPDAILTVSAHWEERVATVQGGATPDLLYDYYGFPEESYHLTYPAPGDPALAGRVVDLLTENGITSGVDYERGFDHGLFIPLMLMFPEADVPALQLSLRHDLDAQAHIDLGKALGGLMQQNILVVGSGFSFHNMYAFDWRASDAPDPRNDAFQDWLVDVCVGEGTQQEERERRLVQWESAPEARYAHPREEHLLPLHVCAGMAQGPAELVFDDYIVGKRSVAFLWS